MFEESFSIQKQWKVFYLPSYEPWLSSILEEIEWLNVQNVEPWFPHLRKHGKWLGGLTNQERRCS